MERRWDVRTTFYHDRVEAGRVLAVWLRQYRGRRPVVLGIPGGGVPVAAEVARALHGELDVLVARKLGSPLSEELAVGAVTADGAAYWDETAIVDLGVPQGYRREIEAARMEDAHREEARLRQFRPAVPLTGRIVIVVDDGLATGATMIAALRSVRDRHPAKLIAAAPVGSRQACDVLRHEADKVVCPHQPDPFGAIGFYYRYFEPTEEWEVQTLLRRAAAEHRRPASARVAAS